MYLFPLSDYKMAPFVAPQHHQQATTQPQKLSFIVPSN